MGERSEGKEKKRERDNERDVKGRRRGYSHSCQQQEQYVGIHHARCLRVLLSVLLVCPSVYRKNILVSYVR